jgi:hypothetical protein
MNSPVKKGPGRGGLRPGAGRPIGAKTDKAARLKRVQAKVERMLQEKGTPLGLMLQYMHELWEAGDKKLVLAVAEKAAAYVHPKLATVDNAQTTEAIQIVVTKLGDATETMIQLNAPAAPALGDGDDYNEEDDA